MSASSSGTTLSVLPASLPIAARVLFKLLGGLRHGRITAILPDKSRHEFGSEAHGIHAHIEIFDLGICTQILTGGDVAFGEGYFNGAWDSPDLVALLTLLAKNQNELMPAFYGKGWKGWLFKLRHLLRTNSKKQARKNIEAHYDLGNNFYSVWLDSTLTYSSAIFDGNMSGDLADAQIAKYERILAEINPPVGGHILEIGCGWGGFAEYAAKSRGVRVTGITLSPSQLEFAEKRIANVGLTDQVHFALCDYRDVGKRFGSSFDGVASIEMFEAVGQKYWDSYFTAVQAALKPGARACVQVITIDENRFEQYESTSDFIQQYIFPGGMLPSPERFMEKAKSKALTVSTEYEFGLDYAETLRRWLRQFDARHDDITAQGFSVNFVKLWRFYLAYCIAGFEAGSINVGQYTLVR
ncbi:MAG: cyclopropane-fatty-acyl-phospholipid synthase family protein [Casimicrobium sp.]